MYTIPPKKMVIINILDILRKYTDMEHRLTQQQIVEKLKKEYYMDVDRKTVKRNLMNLLELDCGIDYTEISRKNEKGEETSICTDWYMDREFTDSELRMIIDSLLFSKNIPHTQCRQLIEKIKGLSNIYFDKKVKHICNLPENRLENSELFYTIDILEDAITRNKKVAFTYNSFGIDKKLHPKREEEYIVNPYQMVATNGRYYLICNYDKYDDLSNYRIDHITNIRILDESAKHIKKLKEGELDLPKHMTEHLYMFAGESVRVKFRAKHYIIDQVLDWFGTDVNIVADTDDECFVEVKVNSDAFFYWVLQYGLHIEVLEPLCVREQLIDAIRKMGEKYGV